MENLIETGGKIEEVKESPTSNNKIKTDVKLVNDLKRYSMFSTLPDNANIGDNIYFKYKEVKKDDRTFYNIDHIIAVEKVGDTPTDGEKKAIIRPERTESDEKSLKASEIDSNKAILMRSAVELCIKRNDLSDESVEKSYNRLLNLVNKSG